MPFEILSKEACDEGARCRLQVHSNWPTYPQLYVDWELLGGADIVLEMAADGGLQEVHSNLPLRGTALDACESSYLLE